MTILRKSMRISKDGVTIKDLDLTKRTAVIAQSTYGSEDRDGDISTKGMFKRSWNNSRSDIRLFKNHDKNSGPGRVDDFWETEEHGLVKAYFGTHTEGNDTLIQIDEGIIVAASFGFIPIKDKAVKLKSGKGYEYKEVHWLETSVLTHWGSHPESGIVSVIKSLNADRLKELNEPEKSFLRALLTNKMQALKLCMEMGDRVTEGDDMWSYINELIGEQSYNIAWLKRRLEYGIKELGEIRTAIKTMEKFVSSTKASDECIQQVQFELDNTKQLLSEIESVATHDPASATHDPSASNDDNEFLKQINYSLLKLKVS